MNHPAYGTTTIEPLLPLEKNMAQKAWPTYKSRWTKKPNESYRDAMDGLFGKGVWKESPGDSYADGEGGTFIFASSTGDLKSWDVIIRIHRPGKEEIRQAQG